jgi:hypothetical protein
VCQGCGRACLAFIACPKARKASKPDLDAAAKGSSKKKKKKADGKDKPLAGAPFAAAAAVGGGCGPCGDKQPCQPSNSDEGGPRCPVHNSKRHSAKECQEIKKLVEQFCEQ